MLAIDMTVESIIYIKWFNNFIKNSAFPQAATSAVIITAI